VPHAARLAALRAWLAQSGCDAYIVPRADAYQSEFPPPCDTRLAWLTGFTGSAGCAVVTPGAAAVFSDARYTLQMEREIDPSLYAVHDTARLKPPAWIPDGARLGYDPWLHTPQEVAGWRAAGVEPVACADNPVDILWIDDRPTPPAAPIRALDVAHAGREAVDKIAQVAAATREAGAGAALIAAPESVCWLLNMRGGDTPYTPVALSRVLVYADGRVDWFVPRLAARGALPPLPTGVTACDEMTLNDTLMGLHDTVLWIDPAAAPAAVANRVSKIVEGPDPCAAPRARKTRAETAGIRDAHHRDGLALTRFLAWMARQKEPLTEVTAAQKLSEFRSQDPAYKGPSFPTICGFNANGAVVHYRAMDGSCTALDPPGLLLLDSGGQYTAGTTDVTRVIALGPPTDAQRRDYTHVLKAHIALATQVFPEGTTGAQLDAIARAPLWAAQMDYAHGTGHGVGCALAVHEGPVSLSPRSGAEPLAAGMVLSNEPGFYAPGAYGIRIENLVLVVERAPGWLAFETLTLAPLERALIVPDMLTATERAWLNAYHAQVRAALRAALTDTDLEWLEAQTAPL
jgi:Xaa-Pro aminopeptidase